MLVDIGLSILCAIGGVLITFLAVCGIMEITYRLEMREIRKVNEMMKRCEK